MSIKNLFIIAILLVFSGTVASLAVKSDQVSGTWRYRMTVVVETPEGVKIGSAVREVRMQKFTGYNPQVSDFREKVDGEAVVVDLGKRGIVFAIMDQDGSIWDVARTFPGPRLFSREGVEYYGSLTPGRMASMPQEHRPLMVTFKDMSDPRTVTVVYEQERHSDRHGPGFNYTEIDRFEEIFGNGVRLRDVTIEITDEPLTWKIEDLINQFGGGAGKFDRSRFKRVFK